MAGHYLILGGGLAGSFMAARLCLAGQRVTLIDDRAANSA
ncbi:MAG: NAD(P)-binding protein, partial [Bacteroidota bacterium]